MALQPQARLGREITVELRQDQAKAGDVLAFVPPARMPFEEFVEASSSRLFTMALLLCGQHRAEAEDLLQGVLERAYRRWPRICRGGDPTPYVRQMIVNAAADRRRALRRRPEAGQAAEMAVSDRSGLVDDRDLLVRALAQLPVGQRAVIVLRYFEDLSEAQTAAVLGCSEGNVKSQASRALAKLREMATRADLPADASIADQEDPGDERS
jgi:RNA polymerase sigma-70 factor (sigma-E family)